MPEIRLGKVTAIHPESHRVDLIMLDDGAEVPGVQVIGGNISTRTGVTDLPDPVIVGENKMMFSDDQDSIAVVAAMGPVPVVLGFIHPSSTQMLFKEKERMVYRHASDVYITIDPKGNTEIYHPSGTYFRIGEASAHEDLTGLDHERKWAIDRNTDTLPYCKLVVANGGAEQASIEMTPTGDINITAQGGVNIDVTGDTTITTPKATINGDADVTGNVNLNGGAANIVTTASVCAFTGAPHPAGSATCKAGGG